MEAMIINQIAIQINGIVIEINQVPSIKLLYIKNPLKSAKEKTDVLCTRMSRIPETESLTRPDMARARLTPK